MQGSILHLDAGSFFEMEAASEEPRRSNSCSGGGGEIHQQRLVNQITWLPAAQFFDFIFLSRPFGKYYLLILSPCGADGFNCGCSQA